MTQEQRRVSFHVFFAALFLSFVPVSLFSLQAAAEDALQGEEDLLSTLEKEHPRLILPEGDLERLKTLSRADPRLAKSVADVLAAADALCGRPPVAYRKIGPRLLAVSRECLRRVYTLGLAWRWTGKERYAEKAEENLLAACAFKDWNPSHFLDTAEMSHAVGVGYDWLYRRLDETSREAIRSGLVRNGLEPGLAAYGGRKKAWWVGTAFNWNQVCNSGLVIGALAVAETDPDIARKILAAARASLPRALGTYEPDGAWPEGPGYWNYATSYTVYGLAAMESALGTDFGLSERRGLAAAGFFPLYTAGPAGFLFNYADCGERSRARNMPCLFWLAGRYKEPFLAAAEHALVERNRASPLDVIWYLPGPEPGSFEPPERDRLFRGPVEVALMRSAWGDEAALFAGVKAGYNRVNHGHLDLGGFVFDALGVRWASDLGSDDYDLPGYWDMKKGGRRWTYFRLNSRSHSVPLLGGKGQDPRGRAKILRFSSRPEGAFAVIDLTGAYEDFASRALRGVALTAGRRALLVQDEFHLKKPCEVLFAMTTRAKIETDGAGGALLSRRGKKLQAKILSPAGTVFTWEPAERKPPQKRNKGVRRLLVRLPGSRGALFARVAVLLAPVRPDGGAAPAPPVRPLDEW